MCCHNGASTWDMILWKALGQDCLGDCCSGDHRSSRAGGAVGGGGGFRHDVRDLCMFEE